MEQHVLPLTGRARVLALGLGGFVMLACTPAQLPNPEAVEPVLTPASGETARLAAPEAAASSVGLGADGKPARQGLDLAAPLGTDRPEPSAGETAREPELPRGTLVLHVGDSFAGSLGVPLSKRLKAAGLRSVLEYQTASYIPTWASSAELGSYVARYSPDLVLITLGANEFELSAPDTRANAVRRLVRRLEGRPCVWVSPPRWKPDTGILRVIRENLKPCRFLDSDTIVRDLGRKKDRIHPSDEAREIWADAVVNWLARERKSGAERPWELREE